MESACNMEDVVCGKHTLGTPELKLQNKGELLAMPVLYCTLYFYPPSDD